MRDVRGLRPLGLAKTDMKSRLLLTAFGFPLSLVGAWISLQLLPSVSRNNLECFAYPCTPPNIRALFALALGGLIAGVVMLGLAATAMKTSGRLAALGFPLSLFGAWASWLLLRGILEQAAGICEIACVTALTVPL